MRGARGSGPLIAMIPAHEQMGGQYLLLCLVHHVASQEGFKLCPKHQGQRLCSLRHTSTAGAGKLALCGYVCSQQRRCGESTRKPPIPDIVWEHNHWV